MLDSQTKLKSANVCEEPKNSSTINLRKNQKKKPLKLFTSIL